MSQLKIVRTSLEVGFPEGDIDPRLQAFRGRDCRSIPLAAEFPFENSQFEVVMLHASAVNRESVREAHRVLRPDGFLRFVVPEKNSKQAGFTLPEIYSVVREGFNILEVELPAWWRLTRRGRTIAISAQKKNWRSHVNSYRPWV